MHVHPNFLTRTPYQRVEREDSTERSNRRAFEKKGQRAEIARQKKGLQIPLDYSSFSNTPHQSSRPC